MKFPHPKHGTIAAYLALFIALGGTSYAATQLAANSVGNKQLRNSAVTGAKVRNGSLSATDFRSSSLPKGATGASGPAGATGPAGPTGASGSAPVIANVVNNGTVDPATSTGLTSANITRNIQGLYCISGLSFTPRNVQITTQNGFNGAATATASLGQFGQCATGTQITIVIRQDTTGAAIDNAFFLTIN